MKIKNNFKTQRAIANKIQRVVPKFIDKGYKVDTRFSLFDFHGEDCYYNDLTVADREGQIIYNLTSLFFDPVPYIHRILLGDEKAYEEYQALKAY